MISKAVLPERGHNHCTPVGLTSAIVSGGASGVMVIVVENGHGDASSNPGQG